ncbi:lytic transglycosylase domain-containing protein [Streptomyces massasporeus]|uniref:lytic transglycosylase domain-containing protein n=1 Tax=Streptomyces massasporeus TaxID=67324 RepID=UPI0037215464
MAAQFGRRLRKGAATTAVAAVAVAALSASQAPGVNDHGRQTAADATPSPEASASDGSATGNSPYYTDLPPLKSPNPSPSTGPAPGGTGTTESGIPATVLDAYKRAETTLREAKPGCNLPWQLLAAIGRVESGQARGGRVDADGTTIKKILGPQLDGNGFALIKDTDDGAYDGNSSYDQAVGPMQFIPSTWAWAGRDGNGDGKKDPNNIYDAALAAGHYLCRNNWDLSQQSELDRAILSYNNSRDYLNLVMRWLEYYRKDAHEVPDGTGTLPGNRSDDGAGASPTPTVPGATTPAGSRPGPGPKPEKPDTPQKPGGGGTTSPKPPTTPPGTPSPPPTTPPTPTDTVDHLEDAGTAKLTAMAGDAFGRRISTRAETEAGKAVAKVRVRFTIVGDTDTTFTGGEDVATVATNSSGVAVAPALQAGEKTGTVTVRATVVGRAVPGLDYKATVTERAADALARTGDAALTCAPGGTFANQVELKATYKGAVADGVAATATLIKSADDPTVTDKGPYFKDADGKTVRTLTGLKTDAKGLLKLPKLYADDTTGTFLLRVTTTGGATLTVELTVAAAETSSPSPSASPSA